MNMWSLDGEGVQELCAFVRKVIRQINRQMVRQILVKLLNSFVITFIEEQDVDWAAQVDNIVIEVNLNLKHYQLSFLNSN